MSGIRYMISLIQPCPVNCCSLLFSYYFLPGIYPRFFKFNISLIQAIYYTRHLPCSSGNYVRLYPNDVPEAM